LQLLPKLSYLLLLFAHVGVGRPRAGLPLELGERTRTDRRPPTAIYCLGGETFATNLATAELVDPPYATAVHSNENAM
jgi:hypothetical protein